MEVQNAKPVRFIQWVQALPSPLFLTKKKTPRAQKCAIILIVLDKIVIIKLLLLLLLLLLIIIIIIIKNSTIEI